MAIAAAALAIPERFLATTTWHPSAMPERPSIAASFVTLPNGDSVIIMNTAVVSVAQARSVSAWVCRQREDGVRFALMQTSMLEDECPISMAG